jgi:hypothetical protein
MARLELTTNGLKLFRDADGSHWLHLGSNAALCVESLTEAPIIKSQIEKWLTAQVPASDQP